MALKFVQLHSGQGSVPSEKISLSGDSLVSDLIGFPICDFGRTQKEFGLEAAIG